MRHDDGSPVVLRNAPLLHDGTPMPTRYWLVGEPERTLVSRGWRRPAGCGRPRPRSTRRCWPTPTRATPRSGTAAIPAGPHRPATVRAASAAPGSGVKCLHAHYAWHLAGGDDPVGRWVADRLAEDDGRVGPMPTLAAIDCGTNSTRLLISQGKGHAAEGRRPAEHDHPARARASTPPGGSTRRRSSARSRCCAATRRRSRSTAWTRCASPPRPPRATRRTPTSFFDAAEAIVGVRPELISGDEEGALSFAGATAELDPADGPFLVVDIGGGSTELHRRHHRGGGGAIARHRVRAPHREAPAQRPARAGGAVERDRRGDRASSTRPCARTRPSARPHPRRRGRHHLDGGRGGDRPGRVGPRRDPPLPASPEPRPRTCSERWPPRQLADRLHNPGLEAARADVIVGGCCVLVALLRTLGSRRAPGVGVGHPRRPGVQPRRPLGE